MSESSLVNNRTKDNFNLVQFLQKYGSFIVLAAILLINVIVTPNFWGIGTLRNIIIQSTPIILASMGMTLVIAAGGIDISVGSVMAVASMVAALNLHRGILPAILIAIFFATLCGLFNGFIVATFKIQPIIATLAMMIAGRGIAQVLNNAMIILIDEPSYAALGTTTLFGVLPIQIIYIAVVVAVVYLLIKKTTFGSYVQTIGDNPLSARLAGVSTFGVILAVYGMAAFLSGSAGVIESARIAAADGNTMGRLLELDAIAAVAVGGTILSGGKANVMGTLAGALIMQLITITVTMNNIPFEFSQIMKALIIIFAVYLQREKSY